MVRAAHRDAAYAVQGRELHGARYAEGRVRAAYAEIPVPALERAEGGFELGLGLRVYGAAFDVRDEARESVQPVRGDAVAAVVGEDSRRDFGLFGREALFDEYRLKKVFQFAVGDAHPFYFPAFALVSLSIASQRPLR